MSIFSLFNKKKTTKIKTSDILLLNALKYYMLTFYEETYQSKEVLNITHFNCEETSEKIIFQIVLENPGNLIGKGGDNLNDLTTYLTKRCNKQVEIEVQESTIWKVYYELLPETI